MLAYIGILFWNFLLLIFQNGKIILDFGYFTIALTKIQLVKFVGSVLLARVPKIKLQLSSKRRLTFFRDTSSKIN